MDSTKQKILKQKILLLLLGGLAFGYSITPNRQWRVLKEISREWKRINKQELRREIRNLYRSKSIKKQENKDGSVTISLTEKGKTRALTYHFEKMIIESDKWDGKWRLVIFDIPERIRNGRYALRKKIKELGFYELQKSVWVFPYECKNEIDFIVEFFGLKEYVRFCVIESIDNEFHLKKIFKIK
jgi:DNA-binding transcriptional regulator PaaX